VTRWTVLLCLLLPSVALANPADRFGLGAASMGRGAAGIALDADAYSAWRNPAALGRIGFGEVTAGIHGGMMRFPCFSTPAADGSCPQTTLWDGNRDGVIQPSNPFDRWHPDASDYKAPTALRVGVAVPWKDRLRIALSLSLPLDRILLIQQEDPYLPHYTRWRNRPHRLVLNLAGSVKIVDGLWIGGGVTVLARARLSLGFQIEARASDDALGGTNPGGDDLGDLQVDFVVNPWRIEVDVVPHLAPTAGILWDLGGIHEPLRGLRIGAVYRHPVDILIDPTNLSLDLYGVVDDVGELGDVLIPVRAQVLFSILDFSTPRQVAAGLAWDRPEFGLAVDVTWHQWSEVLPSVARIDEENTDAEVGLVDLQPRVLNARVLGDLGFTDTVSIQVGGELRPPPLRLRGLLRNFKELGVIVRVGYGYDPAFVPEQTGLTNLLDNNTHRITAGLGLWTHDPFGLLRGPIGLDLFAQAQVLEERTHTKDAALSSSNAPGWPTSGTVQTGGWAFIGGADVTLRF
jgi:long-subunit fatty acid transport protein